MKRRLAAAALVLAASGGLVAALRPALVDERIAVVEAMAGGLRQTVVVSGKVRSPQRIELASQVAGQVRRVLAEEGQRVDAGQVLIELHDEELRAALEQAQAGLAQSRQRLAQLGELGLPLALEAQRQAEANLVVARQAFERSRELVARGFYSRNQLDDARRNLDVAASQLQAAQLQVAGSRPGGSEARLAESAVAQAQASVALAASRLAYARIAAPAAGVLLARNVEPGAMAQPGQILMTISPAGHTELTAQVDEKNLGLLRRGQQALASADAYPDRRFAAGLDFISPVVDAPRGSVEVRLRVPAPPDYLRQEMTVSIDIEVARREQAVVVPLDAVRDAAGAEPWVLVVRDGIARRQAVRLGARGGDRVEVVEGLHAGDELVAAAGTIRDGSRVRRQGG